MGGLLAGKKRKWENMLGRLGWNKQTV